MKKVILAVLCLVAGLAHAQDETGWKVDGANAIGRSSNVVRLEGKEGVEITADVAGEAKGVKIGKYGNLQVPVTAMTPATSFTPTTGSTLKAGVNMVPTASPTLAVVFVEPAKLFKDGRGGTQVIISDSANPTLIHPLPNASNTPTSLNAAAVGTPYSSAAGAVTECIGVSETNARCRAR